MHNRFNLLSESLFLTVNLIDRFLSLRPISLNKLQLVGLACFFIATKFEETCAPSVSEIVFLSDNQYTVPEVLKAEMYILKIVEWDLRCPGPMNWLRRGSKADECDGNARTVAKYFTEIACLERRLVGVVPSLVAAAALWLGRLVVGKADWVCLLSLCHPFRATANLTHPLLDSEPSTLLYLFRGRDLPCCWDYDGVCLYDSYPARSGLHQVPIQEAYEGGLHYRFPLALYHHL